MKSNKASISAVAQKCKVFIEENPAYRWLSPISLQDVLIFFYLNARRIYWRPIGKVDLIPSKPTTKIGVAPYCDFFFILELLK